ncbi:sensor histidine kinase [Meiothermus rufus]|uniref:sensor histidine kinase n=1 Tax=Meiothermus rufus TaxID=604332 RepID=UPI0003F969C0|nr:HAMP domain-containing sensor histidine kinase [Meiothermus rufus]
MSLQLRLTLAYALVLTLVLLGAGATAYTLFVRDLSADFEDDLERLAGAYAAEAVARTPVMLRPLPPAPIPEEIADPSVYLFTADGRLLQAIGGYEDLVELPALLVAEALQGEVVSFSLQTKETRPLWQAIFSLRPVPHIRKAVIYPIATASADFQIEYLLVVSATDLATMRVLQRLRQTVLVWLGLGSLMALLAGFWMARWVSRPLQEIAETARSIEQGELHKRIPRSTGQDEIARLKQSLNAMLERLEALVEAQSRFTADAAHDLRTPLAVLKGDLEITLRRERSAAEYREALERMRLEVGRLIRLAEDLLTLARLESGLCNPFTPFHLDQALETILPALVRAAQQKGLSLHCQIPPQVAIHGDAGLVARAVANLLANAIAHTEKGAVGVSAEIWEDRVRIRVWDSGPGVPPTLRQQIFERFSKGERSQGAGLGLSIVAQVARLHQGGVWVEDREGGGAVFLLELPKGILGLRQAQDEGMALD